MLLLILLAASIFNVNASIDIKTSNESCALKIYGEYKETHTLIIKTKNHPDSDVFGCDSTKIVFYLEKDFSQLRQFGVFNMFIFLLNSVDDLKFAFSKLSELKMWNTRVKFLISFQEQVDLLQTFEITWKYFIYNVVIIENERIYTFFPYRKTCGEYLEVEMLGTCEEIPTVYPDKIPLDLQNCPVKLVAFPLSPLVINISKPRTIPTEAGLEVTIIHNIFLKMNITAVYIKNPYYEWGKKLPNGTYTHVYGMVHSRIADIMFGFVYANNLFDSDFDPTVSHLTDIACWFLPTAAQIPAWKNLTKIFEKSLWIIIILMFLLNGILWWIIGRKTEPVVYFREIVLAILSSWCVLLQSSLEFPKSIALRLMFFCWCIVCLMICTAYTSQLISYLTNPLYEHQINSVLELLDSNLKHGFFPAIERVFSPKYQIEKRILTDYVACDMKFSCVMRAASDRDIGAISNVRTMNYLIPREWTYPNGRKMLFEVRDQEIRAVLRYNAFKGFPLLDRMNTVIYGLQENGLIAKWDEDLKYFVQKHAQDDGAKPLTVDHVQAPFYILAMGICIAFSTFLLEIIYYKMKKLKFRKGKV